MMVTSTRPPRNAFVRVSRKIYNPIGFSKGYNFILWFIFVGALFGFSLARLEYLDFNGIFCTPDGQGGALPGECYYYTKFARYHYGIIIHLATVVPGSLLACFQFVPWIRYNALLFHRINGYLVILLILIGTGAAFAIARRSVGGGIDIQIGVGALGVSFIASLTLAYVNIKRLQIEQHRAWMIRAWVYAGVIITTRIGLIVGAIVVSAVGGYYAVEPCDKINYTLGQNATLSAYPDCAAFYSGANFDQQAVVKADFNGSNAMEIGASLSVNFGAALWFAFALHALGAELYLRLTPAEGERLRKISYQRQLEAGMKNPGRAGITADRIGDSEMWVPKQSASNGNADAISLEALAKPQSHPSI
ncbi:hypothetical protein F5Y18DRAFT_306850 [Xylariaceae sp. FL1019]|nr:hypothetical protein F5Y18DRAFT_306850 [Xylariaceae sp. FL1019]